MNIEQRLSSLLAKRNMTAYALAKQTEVSQSIISYLLHGKSVNRIQVGTAKLLANALGVSLDYFCGMHEDAERV